MKKPSDTQIGGDHYNTPIQHHEFVRTNNIPWHESNTIKYAMRHKRKNGIQDVSKAIHYMLLMAELEYSEDDQRILHQQVQDMLPHDVTRLEPNTD